MDLALPAPIPSSRGESTHADARADEPWPIRRVVTAAVLVYLGCTVGAVIGSVLRMPVSDAAILFPPYAVLTAALLLTPTRLWWVVIVAAVAGDFGPPLVRGRPVSFIALAEVGNTLRALIAAGGLRLFSVRLPPRTLNEAALFIAFVALLGPAATAPIGGFDTVLHQPGASFWRTTRAWLLSNALTGISFVPLIVRVARDGVRWLKPSSRARSLEAAAVVASIMAVGLFVFLGPGGGAWLSPYLYLALALVTWAAVRFTHRGAIGTLSLVTAFAIGGVVVGRGPFVPQSEGGVLQLQLFLVTMYVPVLLLAAVVGQLQETLAEVSRARARYRSVVEDQTELICRFLPDGTYTFVNGAYARYFERAPEELIGRSFWMFIPRASHAESMNHLAAFTPERPVATFEHEVITPSGEVRWQQWTDRALFDAGGQVLEFQSVGRDVTDRRRAEEKHRQIESQRRVEETLRETDRRKDEFLAILAHELRNPLAPISLAVETMRRERLSSEAATARDMIARQVVHMSRLVDDLLDISRITHGKIELALERVDLVAIVLRAVEATRHKVDARRHELVMTLPGLPVGTCVDPARIIQIVSNLLDNAAKYTPQGGRIELTLEQRGSEALITVRDSGEGIAREQLEQIFEPFTQASGAAYGVHGGLGIGLTLVQRLVELHGGDIQATSPGLGQGAEFTVRLPLHDLPIIDPVSSALPSPDQTPLRILVVDDNVDAAVALAQMLRGWGHTVRVSHDGPEALQAHTIFGPDVVLLDLGLPGIDGVEVGRRMRRSARGEPLLIVAITGFGQPTDRQRTTEAGFDEHFTKPVAVPVLQRLLQAWADATRRAPAPHHDAPPATAAAAV